MRLHATAILALCILSATDCHGQTLLGPLPYLSSADSPFNTVDPTYVLETFEDNLFNVPGVTANAGVSVIGPGFNTDSVDADDGAIDGSGTNGRSMFSNGQVGVTYTFDAAVLGGLPTHAGIVWTDGDGTVLFEAFGPGDVLLGSVGPAALPDDDFFGGTAEDRFFGVIDAGGIAKIKITNTSGGIEVDHLQFSFGGSCTATPDINGDRHVDAADLALLLGGWGACPAGCCEADFDDDGVVSAADLAILLGAWGS